ncbi:hypothetical protein PSTT_00001, partial [Puccinia striiformis]
LTPALICSLASLTLATLPVPTGRKIITAFDGHELPDLNGDDRVVDLSSTEASLSHQLTPSFYAKVLESSCGPAWKQMQSVYFTITTSSLDDHESKSLGQNAAGSRKQRKASHDLVSADNRPGKRNKLDKQDRPPISIQTQARPPNEPIDRPLISQEKISTEKNSEKEKTSTAQQRVEDSTSTQLPPFFKVYDWDFLRARDRDHEEDVEKSSNYKQQSALLQQRNQTKINIDKKLEWVFRLFEFIEDSQGFFWIRRRDLPNLIRIFNKQRHLLPRKYTGNLRTKKLSELILKLSDQKLGLDLYPILTDKILIDLKIRIESRLSKELEKGVKVNSEGTINFLPRLSNKKVLAILKYVANRRFLIIFNLTLFKEHGEGDLLTKETVEEILNFLREFWIELEILANNSKLLDENPWARQISKMLRLEFNCISDGHSDSLNRFMYRPEIWYHKAWRIVHYWTEKKRAFNWKGWSRVTSG